MQDIRSYAPKSPKFKIEPRYSNFPPVLFDGAKDMAEVRKHLADKFLVLNTKAKVFRLLDTYETQTLRANYGELMENDKLELEQKLSEVKTEAKRMIEEASDKLQAVETQINDLIRQIKLGTKEVELEEENSYQMTVANHRLYYSWIDGKFTLTRVDEIPQWEMRDLFSQQEANHKALKDMFGFDFSTGEVADKEPQQEQQVPSTKQSKKGGKA